MPKVLVDYVWRDSNNGYRSKIRVLDEDDLKHVPDWNYDGSSTGQADVKTSEVVLKPVQKVFSSPFLDNCYLVFCNMDLEVKSKGHWYAFEQEFFLYPKQRTLNDHRGKHYCGTDLYAPQRHMLEVFLLGLIHSGFDVTGTNAEVAPNQYEIQIGKVEPVSACVQLHLLRYLLLRMQNRSKCRVDFSPKPEIDQNGSGLHTNISTPESREDSKVMDSYMKEAAKFHVQFQKVCGVGNEKRLTGKCETSDPKKFTYGPKDRTASVRICYGYFEDRRPGSNAQPEDIVREWEKVIANAK